MTVVYTNTNTYSGASWQPASSFAGMSLVSTQTASSSGFISWTNLTSSKYILVFQNIVPATDSASLTLQMSANNGSTWISTGYQTGVMRVSYNSGTALNTASTSSWILTGTVDSVSTIGCYGCINIYNMNGSTAPVISGNTQFQSDSSNVIFTGIVGGVGGNTSANSLRVLFDTGNIASGSLSLYQLA